MPAPTRTRAGAGRSLADRFGDLMAGSVRRLPFGLARAVPGDLAGYAVVGALTFAVDVALLVLLDWATPVPLTVCVLAADVIAWALHYVLNRTVNFRSQAPMGPEAMRYGVVVVACLVISAGVTTVIAALGPKPAVARVMAWGCLALFGYVACRWWVFRHRSTVVL